DDDSVCGRVLAGSGEFVLSVPAECVDGSGNLAGRGAVVFLLGPREQAERFLAPFAWSGIDEGTGMSYRRKETRTAYIEWAKLHTGAKYNLAASGVKGVPLSELQVKLDELELSAAGSYGYPPLLERLAVRYGVARKNVATAIGTSLANYLAMSAVLEPG